MQKARLLLEGVQQNLWDYSALNPRIFPEEVHAISPKISRGENYLGLPWLILDYPRYFEKQNIFAIRTMFWWGNFFSTTLQLSGKYKDLYEGAVINSYEEWNEHEFYFCIHEGQWHHHWERENYQPVKKISKDQFAKEIKKRDFIKLAKKISFAHWNSAAGKLSENFTRITGWLS